MLGATFGLVLVFYWVIEFQSSPSLGAGSNGDGICPVCGDWMFQSSPSLGAGSNRTYYAKRVPIYSFQSSPSLGAGSNRPSRTPMPGQKRVSILSQLRCWEQRRVQNTPGLGRQFQSSPSLGAGSNLLRLLPILSLFPVSILSQLRCWEQQDLLCKESTHILVSILSQLRCWEQQAIEDTYARAKEGFNPLPA